MHEAHEFTPWLLNNVDVLSDLLGMDLVLEVVEHPVGGFSLDLLGPTSYRAVWHPPLPLCLHLGDGRAAIIAAGLRWLTPDGSTNTRSSFGTLGSRVMSKQAWKAKEAEAVRAEGLDPDDPAVIAAIDLVRWELSLGT